MLAVQKLVGHQDQTMTQRYSHLSSTALSAGKQGSGWRHYGDDDSRLFASVCRLFQILPARCHSKWYSWRTSLSVSMGWMRGPSFVALECCCPSRLHRLNSSRNRSDWRRESSTSIPPRRIAVRHPVGPMLVRSMLARFKICRRFARKNSDSSS